MARIVPAASADVLELAIAALLRGEVIAIPTETVYGLATLPLVESLERLIAIKQRATDKGIQLLVDSLEQVREVAILTPAAQRLGAAFWPGGLTLVLAQRPDSTLPSLLSGDRQTLGVRLPDHALPRALARQLGPLGASSANISGSPPATDAQLVEAALGDDLSLIIDDGPVRGGVPSTVVDCTVEGSAPRILREGAITADQINHVLGSDYTQAR